MARPKQTFFSKLRLVIIGFLIQTHIIFTAKAASPVVGILTQPRGETRNSSNPHEYVVAASYVKWVEAGGARSIPIPYDASFDLVQDLFLQINGLLLPGGASGVPKSVHYLLTMAMQASESKLPFPVWRTCLGFEYLVEVLSNSTTPVLSPGFLAENVSLPLENVQSKQLYSDNRIREMVTKYNITMNNHHMGIEPDQFQSNPNLNQLFQITSTNRDSNSNGRPFVSTIEPRDPDSFPWYGVQYHPEKNPYEYGTYPGTNIPYEAIDHSDAALEFSNYLARFFGSLVRKQQQQQQQRQYQYQYQPHHEYTKPKVYPLVDTYPMKRGLGFEQYYVVPSAKSWATEQERQKLVDRIIPRD